MRLGRERPRKGVRFSTARRTGTRFNEAGARTPQKGETLPEPRAGGYRFNEAGARTPQKVLYLASPRGHLFSASMRLGRERPRKGRKRAELEADIRELQ